MSWYDGVPAALLAAGPPSNFAAASASSAAAQQLMLGATGDFYLPVIPAGFIQPGKPGQVICGIVCGNVTPSTQATTATFTMGINSSSATAGGASAPTTTALGSWIVGGGTLWAASTTVGFTLQFWSNVRTSGYGTTTISTTLMTNGVMNVGTTGTTTGGISQANNGVAQPITTIDNSVAQYFWMTVTFSTSSASNQAGVEQFDVFGMS